CKHGKVVIAHLRNSPLEELFTSNTTQAREFRQNIVKYNMVLSFTSLGVKEDHSINNGGGPPVFRIRDELHHIGALLPPTGQVPTYAQLYIIDPDAAVNQRMANSPTLRRETMETLQRVVMTHHQYAPIYMRAKAVFANNAAGDDTITPLTSSLLSQQIPNGQQ
ncbi:hypothetical protein GGX14DRAFT_377073, partial [Mycena pura]